MKFINLKGRLITKRWAAIGLIILLSVLLFPFIEDKIEERPRKIELEYSNFYADGFSPLYKSIQGEFNIDGATTISDFRFVIDRKGEYQYINLVLATKESSNKIMYAVEYEKGNDYLIVTKHLLENQQWFTHEFDASPDYFFQSLDELPYSVLENDLMYYRFTSNGKNRGFDIEGENTFSVSNKEKVEVSDSQLPVKGIWLRVCGTNQQTMDSGMFHGCDVQEHWIFNPLNDRY